LASLPVAAPSAARRTATGKEHSGAPELSDTIHAGKPSRTALRTLDLTPNQVWGLPNRRGVGLQRLILR
jgi:hypothetical protein